MRETIRKSIVFHLDRIFQLQHYNSFEAPEYKIVTTLFSAKLEQDLITTTQSIGITISL